MLNKILTKYTSSLYVNETLKINQFTCPILTHFLVMDVVNFQVIKIELIANVNYKELSNRQSKSKQIICIAILPTVGKKFALNEIKHQKHFWRCLNRQIIPLTLTNLAQDGRSFSAWQKYIIRYCLCITVITRTQ